MALFGLTQGPVSVWSRALFGLTQGPVSVWSCLNVLVFTMLYRSVHWAEEEMDMTENTTRSKVGFTNLTNPPRICLGRRTIDFAWVGETLTLFG